MTRVSDVGGQTQTSLQQLQSLEKDFKHLDEQIEHVEALLQIHKQLGSQLRQNTPLPLQDPLRFSGRHEYALRWTLNKLRASGIDGSNARSNAKSWDLLRTLVSQLPSASTARTLNSLKFLTIVESTLNENFTRDTSTAGTASITVTYGGLLDEGSLPPTKKSKRKKSEGHSQLEPEGKRRKTTVDGYATATGSRQESSLTDNNLFLSLSRCLSDVVNLSKGQSGALGNAVEPHVESLLRTDVEQAAGLLGSWLHALVSMEKMSQPVTDPESVYNLAPLVRIWECRLPQAQDLMESSNIAFCKACLLPSTIYLSAAKRQREESAEHLKSTLPSENVQILQQLLAKHVFLPTRTTFHAGRKSQKPVSNGEGISSPGPNLTKMLESLRQYFLDDRNAALTPDGVTILFDVGLRCTPLHSARTKITEAAWIEELLTALTTCMGLDIAQKTMSHEAPSSMLLTAVAQMLGMMTFRGVAASHQLLSDLVLRHAGLESEIPSWRLVAAVVTMRPNVFVDGAADNNSGNSVSALLMSAITRTAWTHNVDEQTPTADVYGIIKDQILTPLMNAFASARSLSSFLMIWQKQLSMHSQQLHEANGESFSNVSVWEDDDLSAKLAELMESSLTNGQISRLLSSFGSVLQSDELDDAGRQADMLSCAEIQQILLTSLRRDETIRELHPSIQQTQDSCVKLLSRARSSHGHLQSKMWQLLAVSQTLSVPLLDAVALERQSLETLQQIAAALYQCVQSGLSDTSVNSLETGTQALGYLGNLLTMLKLRNISLEPFRTYISPVLAILDTLYANGKRHSGEAKAIAFAVMLSRFPVLLSISVDPKKEDGSTLTPRIFEFAKELGVVSSNSSADTSAVPLFWQSILAHASAGDDDLREEIFKYMASLATATDAPKTDGYISFLENTYSHLPITSIPRKSRETWLDATLESMTSDSEALTYRLATIAKLVDLPHGNSHVSTETKVLWTLAGLLDACALSTSVTVPYFSTICKSVISHHQHNLDSERSQSYLAELRSRISKMLKKNSIQTDEGCMNQLIQIGLNSLFIVSKDDKKKTEELRGLQDKLVAQLCSIVADAKKGSKELVGVLNTLVIMDADALQRNNNMLQPALISMSPMSTAISSARTTEAKLPAADILAFSIDTKLRAIRGELPNTDFAISRLEGRLNIPDSKSLLDVFGHGNTHLSTTQRNTIIDHLLSQAGTPSLGTWRLIYLLVNGMASQGGDLEGSHGLTNYAGILCEHVARTTSVEVFKAVTDTIIILLRSKTRIFTQPTIESLLGALVKLSSTSAPALPQKHASTIYTRLTTLTRLLISTHRRALRSRLDTLTILLTNLLRCLFTPDTRSAGLRHRLPVTSWQSSVHALSASHATAYARILTLLCDPSLSTVRTRASAANQGLVDETKRARRYVGQYVPYVLQELCRCVLQGKQEPATRRALMNGVWAVFEVVEKETLEACFAGVSAPGRVVLRGLWEEWRREGGGKWKGG